MIRLGLCATNSRETKPLYLVIGKLSLFLTESVDSDVIIVLEMFIAESLRYHQTVHEIRLHFSFSKEGPSQM